MQFEQVKGSAKLGVVIREIDLAKNINDQNQKLITDLFNKYHVLIFKEQQLKEHNLIRISQLFGKPDPSLIPRYRMKEFPLITKVSNIRDEKHNSIGVVGPHYKYHSDSYCTSEPCQATLLLSLISPKVGGHTNFVNTACAYDDLSATTRDNLENKKTIYRNAYINRPPVRHPMVRVNHGNIKSLYVNKYRAIGIEKMEETAAKALLSDLYDHVTQDKYIYSHQWQNGDLVVWNNFTTMHCSTPIEDHQKRLLYRIIVKPN